MDYRGYLSSAWGNAQTYVHRKGSCLLRNVITIEHADGNGNRVIVSCWLKQKVETESLLIHIMGHWSTSFETWMSTGHRPVIRSMICYMLKFDFTYWVVSWMLGLIIIAFWHYGLIVEVNHHIIMTDQCQQQTVRKMGYVATLYNCLNGTFQFLLITTVPCCMTKRSICTLLSLKSAAL